MSAKGFTLTIFGTEMFDARVYEPFSGASFVAQAPSRGARGWMVTHRGTTMIAETAGTQSAALTIAARLSRACPSASRVRLKLDQKGQPIAGVLTGPHRKLKAEVLAAGGGV